MTSFSYVPRYEEFDREKLREVPTPRTKSLAFMLAVWAGGSGAQWLYLGNKALFALQLGIGLCAIPALWPVVTGDATWLLPAAFIALAVIGWVWSIHVIGSMDPNAPAFQGAASVGTMQLIMMMSTSMMQGVNFWARKEPTDPPASEHPSPQHH